MFIPELLPNNIYNGRTKISFQIKQCNISQGTGTIQHLVILGHKTEEEIP